MSMLLYIDPGTGSMLFAALLGIVSTLYFLMQQLWIKLKYRGGRVAADSDKKELVIFGEGGQYWNVFRPICDELEERGMDCEYYTMDENDPALSANYAHIRSQFIGSDNRAFAKLNFMKAHICLATTPGLNVYQWKRSKGVDEYVHIFHDVGEGTGYRMFGMDDYDTVLMSGAFQERYIRLLEEAHHAPQKELRLAGCTYLDELAKKKAAAGERAAHEGVVVLLAPSWGESAILRRFGEKILSALKETGYEIIVRPHPQSFKSEKSMLDALMEKFPEERGFRWDKDRDNFASLNRADVMITDFSGVMFDYALVFDKPLIYADVSMDTAPYDAAWIDEPVWRMQILPKLGVELKEEDFPRMKEVIDKLRASDRYAEGRRSVGDLAWQERGNAARNMVDYLASRRELPAAHAGVHGTEGITIERKVLLNPGPATTTDSVKLAQLVPDICPREKEFAELMRGFRRDILKLVHADEQEYASVLFCGSGTINMDICLNSLLPEKKKILLLNNGAYSSRAAEICDYYGLEHIDLKLPVDAPVDVEQLRSQLEADKDIALVYTTHHETGTGVLNPIRQIGQLVHAYGAVFVVDTTSSLGMIPIDVARDHIDFCMASAQKGIQGMAGLSFIIGKRALIEASAAYPKRSYYCNLFLQYDFFEKTGEMHFTPPVQTVYAAVQALAEYFAEGETAKWERHKRVAQAIHDGLKRLGLKEQIPREYQSGLVVAVKYPTDGNWDFGRVHDFCYERGFTIYPGKIAGEDTFRLCALGNIDVPDIERFFTVLEEALKEQ